MSVEIPAIREVNRRVFDREIEARLVDDLRGEGYARLSLVAEEGGSCSGEAFMALELVPGALAGVTGEFEFAPPFEAAS